VADVKNLDFALRLADVIVDEEWAVYQFADVGTFSNQAADARKTGQQIDMLDQRTAKVGGGVRVIFGNAANDFSEIV
jgi:hypothetical protein